jgi:hypothetical protein
MFFTGLFYTLAFWLVWIRNVYTHSRSSLFGLQLPLSHPRGTNINQAILPQVKKNIISTDLSQDTLQVLKLISAEMSQMNIPRQVDNGLME